MRIRRSKPYIKEVRGAMVVSGDLIDMIRMMIVLKMSMEKLYFNVDFLVKAMLNDHQTKENESHEQAAADRQPDP